MSIDLEKVLKLVAEPETINLSVLNDTSWFNVTWLCSYIWVSSALIAKESTFEDFLASVFQNDPTGPNLPIDRWIPNCEAREVSEEKLSAHLDHARSDLAEGKSDEGCEFPNVEIPLNEGSTLNLIACYEIVGKTKPCNKHQYGPTYIYVWRSGDWYHYCEIHNES
ncbi:hypothetical protein [Zooshikella harenae]|uniref:Uncharacterized protein n=1 Tax=Zooshikella harenae TaxID=2827238 RepID=A0ABS5ZJ28_9GAMM|nr:hypothetical protein [Zooshikella harenae]MBU2714082.1 hypothetical protein [Zooshikella harenae]